MKAILLSLCCLALGAGATACSKSGDKKDVAAVAQDTMLLHDLAEANRNTATVETTDTTEALVRAKGGAGPGALTTGSGSPQTSSPRPAGSSPQNTTLSSDLPRPEVTRPEPRPDVNRPEPRPEVSRPQTSGRVAPTRANDTGPTTVPTRPISSGQSSSGDPCDSPAVSDQRACLNRSIATNDAELNRVYQDLIAQARLSGGAALEERFRVSQRAWVDRRDLECRRQTPVQEGRLWARGMGRCLAEYSDRRTSELQRSLNNLRGQ